MRRVAITGMGIVSCLGSDQQTVVAALRDGRSGITFNPTFAEMGLRSQVCGSVAIDLDELVERKARRFMGDAAAFACVAMQQAIDDAGLEAGEVSNERTGLIAGSGGASSANIVRGADALREKGVRRLGPYLVPRTMSSTVSACLATHFDAGRGVFVISAGVGMRVPARLTPGEARGANTHAELVGYGATSDGANMVAPSGEGAVRCMRQALATVGRPIDYINTHGTSTPVGDIAELNAMREVFGIEVPPFSSSKSLCGHSLGAAGVQEAIHCLLMLKHGFLAGSANIAQLDPAAADLPVLRESRDQANLKTIMSNNFGFGGTNACLVLQHPSATTQ